MKNVRELMNAQAAEGNPGRELGEFLLRHSNSPAYLVEQLEAYLNAAWADLEADRRLFAVLLAGKAVGGG